MSYEMIALDIDGTLTNSKKEISKPTKRALINLQKHGKKVVLASGRPTCGLTAYAKTLHMDEYGGFLLSYNGARITNFQTGQSIVNQTLPAAVIPELYQFAREHHVGIITYEGDSVLSGNGLDEYIQLEARINHLPIHETTHFVEHVQFPVNKCLMTGKPEHMAQLEQQLQQQYKDRLSIYRSESFFLEIMPPNVDKANSLATLLKSLHLTRKQLISCGDGYNDQSMIAYAGLGVAMANAKERVKAAADFITKSNDDDGVLYVIEQYM